jgi:Circularly permutated YpsA SLOG family
LGYEMGNIFLSKIVSGGQTGADQAALDYAIEHGIPHGGWIPKGRLTEVGPLPEKYNLQEMPTKNYPKRTEKNITDSDGTLIVSHGKMTGGTLLTWELAKKHSKPCIHIDLMVNSYADGARLLSDWIEKYGIKVLNVAGPRASKDSKIYTAVKGLLGKAI